MANDLRYEIKMVCEEWAHDWVVAALRTSRAGVRVLYPPRRVQSVYLDTPLGRSLEENLAGISSRRKMRFRWYGDEVTRVLGRLEIKKRDNMLGSKEILDIVKPISVRDVDRVAFVASLGDQADREWRYRLHAGLEPVQWISYVREYFTTADGRVRVTIDHELRTWDQRYRFILSDSNQTFLPRVLIVEVKCSTEHYGAAQELVNRLPLYVDKCSKFVLASSPSEGPIISQLNPW